MKPARTHRPPARERAASAPPARHRIVVAEDHVMLREGLVTLLAREPDLEVVGEAGDGLAAVEQVRRLKPALALVDLSMPLLSGLDAIREIAKHHGATKAIALTAHNTDEYIRAATRAGAAGYVLKDASSSELLEAIHAVLDGGSYFSATVRRLVGGAGRGSGDGPDWDTVTPREREVLKLVAEGHRNREIAALLGISAKTVETHRTRLMAKLDLHNAAAVTSFAAKKGLIS
jgi:DNA-binding NarL/FixJ family response regulator